MASYDPPSAVTAWLDVQRSTFESWPVFTVAARDKEPRGRALYLHGGGHATELQPITWAFVTRLALATGREFVIPIFPLAPSATHRDVYPTLERLYAKEIAGQPGTAIVADSSGGVLALHLVQSMPQVNRPDHVVLLSPWVDAVMDHPEIPKLEPVDSFSTKPGMLRYARAFAGDADLADPRLSPVRGPLDHLGEITIFAAGNDILTPDVRKLRDSAGPGTTVDLRVYEGRTHMWMLFSDEAATEVVKEIERVLT
ncbi:alpha/beta hydrolase fold domain-containing protein [Kibdelosporangium aridum]|nr:alpha/beta hydrolase [Kibdelosporangium aridum]